MFPDGKNLHALIFFPNDSVLFIAYTRFSMGNFRVKIEREN